MVASAGAITIASVVAVDRIAALLDVGVSEALVQATYGLVVAVAGVALAADLRLGAWSRSAATGIVVELGTSSDATSLRDRLAGVLGDPTSRSACAAWRGRLRRRGRTGGRPAAGRVRAELCCRSGRAQRVVSVIVDDATVIDDEALAGAVAAAARLAVATRVSATRSTSTCASSTPPSGASSRRRTTSAGRSSAVSRRVRSRPGPGPRDCRRRPAVRRPGAAPVDVRGAVRAADDELRAFARGVYPPRSPGGLAAAIAELAAAGTLPVTVAIEGGRLPVDVETTAYFVCAEALANASKHARAGRVTIAGTKDGGALRLTIADEGVGGADPAGSGLRGLRDRVAALGGTFDVDSPAGGGTTVRAVIPVRPSRVERPGAG